MTVQSRMGDTGRRRLRPDRTLLVLLCTLLLFACLSQVWPGASAFRQIPLLPSAAPEPIHSSSDATGSKPHQITLHLDHVLHRTTSRFGNKLLQKKLDTTFLARAAKAPAQGATLPGEAFAYSPMVDGTGAEVGFNHPVKVTAVSREEAFPQRMMTPEVNVADMRLQNVILPDVSDNNTIISLAKMCYNAYLEVGSEDWLDLGKKRMTNSSFGWTEDGLRGYIFADESEQVVIIAFKGTTAGTVLRYLAAEDAGIASNGVEDLASQVGATGTDTIARDKLNDNLLFSCCCARVSWTWTPVCGCYQKADTCNQTCVENSLIFQDSYYHMALELYAATALKYPKSTIWLTGHSLGGAVGSLTGLTFGAPSVSFDAPGDLLAAKRLHLPMFPGYDHGKAPHWSIGHTADPIFMGSCTGFSTCTLGGYAMETKCHIGRSIVYDTVTDKGWRVDIRNHRMKEVLNNVLRAYDAVPQGGFDPSCEDCSGWAYE